MHSLKLNEGTYLRGWHAVCLKHEYDRETGVIFDAGFRWERPDGGVVWPFVTKLPRENPKLGAGHRLHTRSDCFVCVRYDYDCMCATRVTLSFNSILRQR